MKHILTLASLVFATSCFGQGDCPELWTACGEGTIWDEESQTCIVANVSDTDFDGCVGINDFLIHLANFGTGCGPWVCGDLLQYKGYWYSTVEIGDQCWFAENLRVMTYRNGEAIPTDLDDEAWSTTSSGAMAIHSGVDPVEALSLYGRLYNLYAVLDERELCPEGWSVPSHGEFQVLGAHLGGNIIAAGKMKATSGWCAPWPGGDGNGDNSSGFGALPGGARGPNGEYDSWYSAGCNGYWWTTSEYAGGGFWRRIITAGSAQINTSPAGAQHGFSVRCLQDSE